MCVYGASLLGVLKQTLVTWTGAPRSPQRTWAENGFFQMLSLDGQLNPNPDMKSDRGAFPGFPVELSGVGAFHAAFLTESRTRGRVQCSVQEIRVARLFRPTYAWAIEGHPSSLYPELESGRRLGCF
jgi:hypothetical protein